MKLSDLTYCQEHTLPRLHSMYRIQRTRRTASTVAIGPVRLPPTGLMGGRFDLPDRPVGYFAEEPETAAYETLARREAHVLSMADLRLRSLLWVRIRRRLLGRRGDRYQVVAGLAARLEAGDEHRLQHGARGIDRGGIPGGTGSQNEQLAVAGLRHGASFLSIRWRVMTYRLIIAADERTGFAS